MLVKYVFIFLIFISSFSVLFSQTDSFQTILGGSAAESYPRVINAGDNEFLILNRTLSNSFGDVDVMLSKIDALGKHIWTRNIGNSQRNFSKTIHKINDGFMLLTWHANSSKIDDWCLIKLDTDGNIITHKFFGIDAVDEEVHNFSLLDNGNYLIGSTIREYTTNARVSLMDSDMNVYKSKTFYVDDGDQAIREAAYSDGNLIICGSTYAKPMLLSVDNEGNLNFMYFVNIPGNSQLRHIIKLDDNSFITVGYSDPTSNGDHDILVVKVKANGDVSWIKTMGGWGDDKAFDIKAKNDGTLLITGETSSYSSSKDVFLINIDKDGNFISGYTYGGSENENFGFFDFTDDDGAIIVAETESFESNSTDIMVIKTAEDGTSCCYNTIEDIKINNLIATTISINPGIVTDNIPEANRQFQSQKWHPESNFVCTEPIKIYGPESVCEYSQNIRYYVDPQTHYGFYTWELPMDAEINNNQNDTAIWVDFGNTPGYIFLNSKYCVNKNFDSIYINLDGLYPSLGGDTSICGGSNIVLNPGSGYTTYLWHDGSTKPNYTADEEGLCWVEVTDSGDCSGRDSINISLIHIPGIDLGPDTILFTGENYELDAGPGFDSYLWNNNSTEQTLLVSEEGQYWVIGSKGMCSDSDSVWLFRDECDLSISNIITPNNDGISDNIFAIVKQPISYFELTIHDLRGAALYKTYDVDFSWDGKINGSILPNGIYVYTMKYLCPESIDYSNKRGKIIIVR